MAYLCLYSQAHFLQSSNNSSEKLFSCDKILYSQNEEISYSNGDVLSGL